MAPLKILHLAGSPMDADYRELSELYARASAAALADKRYEFIFAHISPDGKWRFPGNLLASSIDEAEPLDFARAVQRLQAMDIDCALPQMFCRAGVSDYRALLDLLEIPYLGNRPTQMSIAADKAQTKAIVKAAGVLVPSATIVRDIGDLKDYAGEFPVVVKPNDSDNSDGIALAGSHAEIQVAAKAAFQFSNSILVEQYIAAGREVRCGVIERGGKLLCLPLEEYRIDPGNRPIRLRRDKLPRGNDNAMKLGATDPQEAWIISLDDPVVDAVHTCAKAAYRALGLRQYGLFDFRIDPDGIPWFLEAGPYCSFALDSVIVKMMAAYGTALPEFFAECVADLLQTNSTNNFPIGA